MKLNMTAGQLAAALKAVPAKYAVQVAEGDSCLAAVDGQTVTVYAAKPKAKASSQSKAPVDEAALAEAAKTAVKTAGTQV